MRQRMISTHIHFLLDAITEDVDREKNLAIAKTHKNDDKRNDVGNTFHNIDAYATRFAALFASILTEPTIGTEYILQGLNKKLTKSNGNLIDDSIGALKGLTDGGINAFYRAVAIDVAQLLIGK